MAGTKEASKSPVDAVQAVFDALQPFDDAARQRILTSAMSLLGMGPIQHFQPAAQFDARHEPARREGPAPRPLSPVELIQAKKPATNSQKISLFAYYREKVEGLARFSREDLEPYFAKAKQPAPSNYDRDFRDAVKLGWIFEDGADSYLTSKGLEAVEEGFGGRALPRGTVGKAPKRTKKNKKRRARISRGKK